MNIDPGVRVGVRSCEAGQYEGGGQSYVDSKATEAVIRRDEF